MPAPQESSRFPFPAPAFMPRQATYVKDTTVQQKNASASFPGFYPLSNAAAKEFTAILRAPAQNQSKRLRAS